MAARVNQKRDFERVVQIVSDSGGRVVGRTKLQKIAYLLEAAGLGEGFSFEYRHYGPYSEDLTSAARSAKLLGVLREEERATTWGGFYSIYTTSVDARSESARTQLAKIAVDADPIELELAATAAFLASEGNDDPWGETAKRKPEKASPSRLSCAKSLYRQLQGVRTPRPLPAIV
jgi:uncharacterized protein YwgA